VTLSLVPGATIAGLQGPAGIQLFSPKTAAQSSALNRYLRYEAGFTAHVREVAILITALVAPFLPAGTPVDPGSWDGLALLVRETLVGIAMGNYNPESTQAYFKQQKLPTVKVNDYTLFAFGSGSSDTDLFFFFLDSNKAVFGHKVLLEKLLEIRFGREDGLLRNEQMFSLINEVNGSGVVWAVLNPSYTRLAMSQLAPEVQQFPEAAKLVANMKSMIITATASSPKPATIIQSAV